MNIFSRGSRGVRGLIRVAARLAIVAAATFPEVPLHAQSESPRVAVERTLRFGAIRRSETVMIEPESDSAAVFAVWGVAGRELAITIRGAELVGRDERTMPLTLASCDYSLDGGVSWQQVSDASGWTVRLGEASAGYEDAVMFVRIGGGIAASDTQRRGDYHSAITLAAEYLDDGDAVSPGVPATVRRAGLPVVGRESRTVTGPQLPTAERNEPCKRTD